MPSSTPLKGSVIPKGACPNLCRPLLQRDSYVDQKASRVGRVEGLLYRPEGHLYWPKVILCRPYDLCPRAFHIGQSTF